MADIPKPTGLDWVKLREEMDQMYVVETFWERTIRKCKENPLVPFGAMVTVGALTYGLYNFYLGRSKMQQNMMRLRVAAQMFTVFAAVGGMIMALPKEKKNLEGFIERGKEKSIQ
ncbi:HIG1 domain family member 2A, mitochondrial [Phymastichus coffea]|uniref:HIG1 domain family member 2A, mitochondrial n=1 Tax=Phymastichus coffea TaxID=108790 RepID=UPI00273B5612|nr:HIG1 domain family member 2A, mitochondrial [Phymastichus coffea]